MDREPFHGRGAHTAPTGGRWRAGAPWGHRHGTRRAIALQAPGSGRSCRCCGDARWHPVSSRVQARQREAPSSRRGPTLRAGDLPGRDAEDPRSRGGALLRKGPPPQGGRIRRRSTQADSRSRHGNYQTARKRHNPSSHIRTTEVRHLLAEGQLPASTYAPAGRGITLARPGDQRLSQNLAASSEHPLCHFRRRLATQGRGERCCARRWRRAGAGTGTFARRHCLYRRSRPDTSAHGPLCRTGRLHLVTEPQRTFSCAH